MTYKNFINEYETLLKTDKKKCRQFINATYRSLKDCQDSLRLSVL